MPKQPRARWGETKRILFGGGANAFLGREDMEKHDDGILLSSCCPLLAGGGGSPRLTLRVQGTK